MKKSARRETERIEPEQPISKSNSVSTESTLIWMVQIISLVSLLVSLFSLSYKRRDFIALRSK